MNKSSKYPAIFFFDDDGISVEFPDLPGCLTCGDNEDEAIKMAIECLTLHLFGMERDTDFIPEPTHIENIKVGRNQKVIIIETNEEIKKDIKVIL